MFGLLDALRRARARFRPFPEAWRTILREKAPFYPRLDAPARERFEEKLKVFVLTKRFSGAGGLSVDDEVRVLVAAGAARLSMNLPGEDYEDLGEVIVYPAHYLHPGGEGAVFGEANRWGVVVLSYQAVLHGLGNGEDGHDTTLHEFAHVLDIEDGGFDGTPELPEYAAYQPWARIMERAFFELRGKGDRKTVLRKYGAQNEAEFFAVATEAFFEKPRQLHARHPELYALLSGFYRADPLAELEAARGPA